MGCGLKRSSRWVDGDKDEKTNRRVKRWRQKHVENKTRRNSEDSSDLFPRRLFRNKDVFKVVKFNMWGLFHRIHPESGFAPIRQVKMSI